MQINSINNPNANIPPLCPPFLNFNFNPYNTDSQKIKENFIKIAKASGFNFDDIGKQQIERININNFNISNYRIN